MNQLAKKYLLLSVLLFTCVPMLLATNQASAQTVVRGMVHDGETNHPIPLVNVSILGTERGGATDEHGEFRFSLAPGTYSLSLSAIGYEKQVKSITVLPADSNNEPVTVHVALYPSELLYQEVMVEGRRNKTTDLAANATLNSTEDLMDHVPGVDFLVRANFAWEPVIRGMNGGQVGLVIDGVKVIGACVDKMDPTSSYVEVENLEKLELTKGGFDLSKSSQIGGTINMVTEKPSFNRSFSVTAESGFESSASLRRVRAVVGASHNNTSVRGSFSYKKANDFRAGNDTDVLNSGYTKNNFKVDATQRLGLGHSVTASALADNAWNIGYPVLLMDATLAQARIFSGTHNWTTASPSSIIQNAETKLYTNTVDHWMDDYARNVDERRVMRSMNMPMYGSTRTTGGISSIAARSGRHSFGLTLDGYQTKSFGEMWMFSTLPNIPDMYLLNLGDVVVNNGAIAVEHRAQVTSSLRTQLSARFDYSIRDVENEQAQSILGGRWGLTSLQKRYSIPGVSGSVEYAVATGTLVRLSVANVGRLPTHVENYGHYIYNYVDGYFYSGNPGLAPERSIQVELGSERITSKYGVRANVFYNRVSNYILGRSDSGLVEDAGTYRFRVFDNISAATLMGFELSTVYSIVPEVEANASVSYTRGQNLEFDEPLPLMPPLALTASIRYSNAAGWNAEVEGRGAAPQNRVSSRAAKEDGTDGYFVVNLRGNYPVNNRVEIKAGVDNLFDYYYNEHLSFGNLASVGRNVFAAIVVRY